MGRAKKEYEMSSFSALIRIGCSKGILSGKGGVVIAQAESDLHDRRCIHDRGRSSDFIRQSASTRVLVVLFRDGVGFGRPFSYHQTVIPGDIGAYAFTVLRSIEKARSVSIWKSS